MTPEFVQCNQCQCWNQEHGVYEEEMKRDGRIKNPNFGICQRHAPGILTQAIRETSHIYLKIFRKIIWTGISIYRQNTRCLPHMREDEGCWEGVKK